MNWIEIANKSSIELSYSEMSSVLDGIMKEIAQQRYSEIDRALANFNPNAMSTDAIVAVSRSTYAVRTKLKKWELFVRKSHAALMKRGEEKAMQGLVDKVKK